MVNNLTPISDHCPISCSLLACVDDKTNKNKEKLECLPGKFFWNEEAITRYKNNMQSVEVKQKLQNFINHDYKDCSTAVEQLTSVLHDTALALKETIHKAFSHRNYGAKFVVLGYNSTYFSNKIQKGKTCYSDTSSSITYLSALEGHCFSRSSAYQWVRIVLLF